MSRVIIAVVVLVGSILDAVCGALALVGVLQPNNILAITLAWAGGFILTGMTMGTKAVFSSKNIGLKFLWFIATAIDAMTTMISTVYYVVLGKSLESQPDLSGMEIDSSNVPKALIALGLTILLTGISASAAYIINDIND